MKIAIAQLNPTIGDLAGNTQLILNVADQAAAQGVRLLLTPELSLCGYPPRDLLLNPSFGDAMALGVQELALALPPAMAVLVGTVQPNSNAHSNGGKPLLNSAVWLEKGQVQQSFPKRLLPTYDVFDEARYFAEGTQPNILRLEGIGIGITICEDLWNDEDFWGQRIYGCNPVAEMVNQGVDLIVNLSASPFCVGKQLLRESMLRHTAQRYQRPVLYVNQVGGNDDLIFDGRSVALNSLGDIVGRGPAFDRGLMTLTFDPSTEELRLGVIAPPVEDENAEIWQALVLGVRDYARKCGFSQAVIGLSGGIDSALVAAIAVAALGPENVLGILMPSPYSSDHSIQDAQDLAVNLGITTEVLPIADLMQTYDQALADLFAGTESGVAEENIQARIRGNLLMAIANKFGRLLISTGNKSEMAVGYCTLYGDMNGGLAAISDVPKTRVYALCRWLNEHSTFNIQHSKPHPTSSSELRIPNSLPSGRPQNLFRIPYPEPRTPNPVSEAPRPEAPRTPNSSLIPPHILSKPPSAELKPNQVDQDALPEYEVLDDILYRFIDQHQSRAQIAAAGHEPAIVERIIQMVKRAEFKRCQAPPGLKITDRAFGTGWRMPIAARITEIEAVRPMKVN